MAIRAILSDLGNVVTEFDNAKTAQALSLHSPLSVEEIERRCFLDKNSLYIRMEEGIMSLGAFYSQIRHLLELRKDCTDDRIRAAMQEGLVPIMPVLQLWRELHQAGMQFVAVSNVDHLRWARLAEQEFEAYFDHLVLSFRVGVRKPSRVIFEQALKSADVGPTEALFIDDVPEYVAAARDLGISGHVYEKGDLIGLKVALQGRGISLGASAFH